MITCSLIDSSNPFYCFVSKPQDSHSEKDFTVFLPKVTNTDTYAIRINQIEFHPDNPNAAVAELERLGQLYLLLLPIVSYHDPTGDPELSLLNALALEEVPDGASFLRVGHVIWNNCFVDDFAEMTEEAQKFGVPRLDEVGKPYGVDQNGHAKRLIKIL